MGLTKNKISLCSFGPAYTWEARWWHPRCPGPRAPLALDPGSGEQPGVVSHMVLLVQREHFPKKSAGLELSST